MEQLPSETDEQVASFVLGRAATGITHYSDEAASAAIFPKWEQFLAARAQRNDLSYGMRKSAFDTLANSARTQTGLNVLRSYLGEELKFAGEPIHWDVVTQLLSRGASDAVRLYEAELERDQTPEAERPAFVALAAKPDPAIKRAYFRRYLEATNSAKHGQWLA